MKYNPIGLPLKNKLVKRRVQRRGATCPRDRRGNLIIRQVVSTLFLLSENLISKPYFMDKSFLKY